MAIGLLPPECVDLIALFLDDLYERLGNAGCNDFDLAKHVPDVEARRVIMRKYHEYNGDPEEFDPDDQYRCVMDFPLVGLLAAWVREQKGMMPTRVE